MKCVIALVWFISAREESPNSTGQDASQKEGTLDNTKATESASENIPLQSSGVRVKRRGKSSPVGQ